jgi:uncharacterized sulfatase
VVSIDEPHHPYICPEPFVSAFDEFSMPVGPSADDPLTSKPQGQQEWARHVAGATATRVDLPSGVQHRDPRYFACNSYSDHEVGRVLQAIDRYVPDALVVYTSDHGDMFHAHRLQGKGPVAYEEIARIPLIVRWPKHVPAGQVSSAPVSHIDLVPTLLDYFGLPVPPLLHGRALLAQCRDPRVQTNQRVFIEFNRFEIDHDGFGAFSPFRAVFDGRYKLVVNLLDSDELYDLEADPHEMRNLIASADTAAIRDALHDALLAWQGDTRDVLRGPAWARRIWRDAAGSSWGGPTRPRPFDELYFPRTLLYDTGREIDRWVYDKK